VTIGQELGACWRISQEDPPHTRPPGPALPLPARPFARTAASDRASHPHLSQGNGPKGESPGESFKTVGDIVAQSRFDYRELKLGKELGAGAFGRVIMAEYTAAVPGGGVAEKLAVKLLHPHNVDAKGLKMFLEEVRLMRKIDHPSVVGFRGFGVTDPTKVPENTPIEDLPTDLIYVAQEYCGGGTLKSLMLAQMSQSGGFFYGWTDAFRWMLSVAKGLAEIHGQDPAIIHRDLKPENILFDVRDPRQSEAKIADLGLCKCIKSREDRDAEAEKRGKKAADRGSFTRNDTTSSSQKTLQKLATTAHTYQGVEATGTTGSLMYMAPEVYREETYNEKCDVFSFGMILFEVLKGEIKSALFYTGGLNEYENYARSVANGLRRPFPDHWPEEVTTLIGQLWHQEAQERPSMKRVVTAMQDMVNDGIPAKFDAEHRKKITSMDGCCTIM